LNSRALVRVPVGVIVARRKAKSPWLDYTWSVTEVLPDAAEAAPWTPVGQKDATDRFYVGGTDIQLYRTETANYRDNLASGSPRLWVVLRSTGGSPPYALFAVTADPAEGEAATEAGDDLVEAVAMPKSICRILESFVSEHGVDRPFIKRQRDRQRPEALARRGIVDEEQNG
jgi:hypothetical protein